VGPEWIESREIDWRETPARSRDVPSWCQNYQSRLLEAQNQYQLLKEQEELDEAELGIEEVAMRDQPRDVVQEQLARLAQQLMHIVEACNTENGTIMDRFEQ